MSATVSPGAFGDVILIRYDGLDADRHEIDMALFAESLRGISRIIGVTGNFAASEKIIPKKDFFVVRAVVSAPQAHCFEITAWLQWVSQNSLASTVAGGLVVTLVSYVCAKAAGNKQEMKLLAGALETAIKELGHRDESAVSRMLTTIEKMADSLRPAAREAVAPIGQTARTLTIKRQHFSDGITLDAADKEAIQSESPVEVGEEALYSVRFTEMDVETGSCKVSMTETGDARLPAKITDPEFAVANNRYVLALAAKTFIAVTAKPTMRDGEIERLFISNAPSHS